MGIAADCLTAFRDQSESDEAEVGALLIAEFFALIRGFMTKK